MNNWKQEFEKQFGLIDQTIAVQNNQNPIKNFIEKEIIETLIDEASGYFVDDYGMAKELKERWLK